MSRNSADRCPVDLDEWGEFGNWMRMFNFNPTAMLMSDSARQAAGQMFETVAFPSSLPDEKPSVQRRSTRLAF